MDSVPRRNSHLCLKPAYGKDSQTNHQNLQLESDGPKDTTVYRLSGENSLG